MNSMPERFSQSDRTAVCDLLTRFAWTADVDDLPAFDAYFTQDAIWNMGETTWRGRSAIVAGLGTMRAAGYSGPASGTRHLVHNIDFLAADFDAVRVRSLYTLVSPGPATRIVSIGTYHDSLLRTSEGWRLDTRSVESL